MGVSLNQLLWIIITLSVVVTAVFLVIFLIQLRKTAREGEKTLVEMRELVKDLQVTAHKIDASAAELGEMIRVSRKTVCNVSALLGYASSGLLGSRMKVWALALPALRWGWRFFKKKKEKQNGK